MKKLIIYLAIVLLYLSCKERKSSLDAYKGGIVYHKRDGLLSLRYHIKTVDGFVIVPLYKLDWDKYEIGDTIK